MKLGACCPERSRQLVGWEIFFLEVKRAVDLKDI